MLGPTHAQLLNCSPSASTLLSGFSTIWILLDVLQQVSQMQRLQLAWQGNQLACVYAPVDCRCRAVLCPMQQ
jgi:hypothetical protein